jgi:hypothetical protein
MGVVGLAAMTKAGLPRNSARIAVVAGVAVPGRDAH